MRECDYALYQGDTFIDLGTKKYLAEKMGWTIDYITYLITPSYKNRLEKWKNKGANAPIIIKIDEGD